MAQGIETSFEREKALSTIPADLQTVGLHVSETLNDATSHWYPKPQYSTHVKLQALDVNIRYKIDTYEANPTSGFQLLASASELIPVPNTGISICSETPGASIEMQWVR